MTARDAGAAIIAIGLVVVLVGSLVMTGVFGWFGRLPGDVHVESERVRIYAPLVSMLLISVVLTLVVNAVRRFF